MKQYIYQKIKEVCFVLAGGIIGLSSLPFTEQVSKDWKYVLFSSIGLILIGVGIFDGIPSFCLKLVRIFYKHRKTIAILAPFALNGNTSSWVDINLSDIFRLLREKNIKFTHIKNIDAIRKYPIVINPYGGLYPEEDIANLKTIDKFFDYVRNGGIFVNIADIPFYYAYEENLRRRIDTTPFVNAMSFVRGFLASILTQKLHVLVVGLSQPPFRGVTRVISVASNATNYYQHSIQQNGQEFSPYLAIPYGKGYFLLSTIPVNTTRRFGKLANDALKLLSKT